MVIRTQGREVKIGWKNTTCLQDHRREESGNELEVTTMKTTLTDREREISDVFASVIPKLNDMEKERVLGYIEGMSAFKNMQTEKSSGKEAQ